MIKRGLAIMLTGLMLFTSAYPVNAMEGNIGIEIQDASGESDEEESAIEETESALQEGEEAEETPEETSQEETEASEEFSQEEETEAPEESSQEEETEASEESSQEEKTEASEESSQEETEAPVESSQEEETEVSEESFEQQNAQARQQAGQALRELAATQDLMALVYLVESYEVREKPALDSAGIMTVYSGQTVAIRDVVTTGNVIWYEVTVLGDEAVTGYIEREYLVYTNEMLLEWEMQYLDVFMQLEESQIASAVGRENYGIMEVNSFPESYRTYINEMKAAHPNWHFVPFNIAEDFDVAAENQVGERSLVHSSVDDSWKGEYHSPNWYYAKPFIIRHFMDPRNFLDETNVFQFEQLTYNKSYHNVETVSQLLSKSFMSGNVPNEGVTYAAVFMQAGIESTVSPYHLASRVMQEQGAGTSPLISGTHSKYPGYYNYFNIQASGKTTDEIIENGLAYAKKQGWNTRYKSIVGGSQFIGTGYIKVGQDTLYLQKFDMVGTFYTHQYMQNIMAPTSEGKSIASAYKSAGALNKSFVFKVPVYKNMPAVPCPANQGTITFMREVETDGGLIGYEVCKSYREDKNGPQIKLVPFMDNAGAPANCADFTWAVSDATIASVTNEGIVNFLKPGTATVSATYKGSDSSYKGKKATCKITVYGIWFDDGSSVEAKQYALRIGSSHTIKTTVNLPSDTKDKTLYWKIDDEKIATITTKGKLEALKEGITTLTLTAGDYTQSVRVVVLPKSFETTEEVYYLSASESKKIEVEFEQTEIPDEVMELLTFTYDSENPGVATVSEEGVVTAVSPGETTIRISAQGMVATCKVNVETQLNLIEKKDGYTYTQTLKIPYGHAYGDEESFPVPDEREGYVFVGWYVGENGSGEQYTSQTVLYKNATAYAFFRKVTEGFYVKPVGDMVYTGAALKPEVEVYDGATRLILNRDYKVSYKNNKDVNAASGKIPTVTVKGIGNYSGTQTVTFRILPMDIANEAVNAEDLLVAPTGKKITKKPVVKLGSKKLAYNKDYTLEWRNTAPEAYKEPGVYEITVIGKKNFTGERKVKLTITGKTFMSKCSIGNIAKQTYQNGTAICPDVTVKYKSKVLLEGKDYMITYRNNKEIGTASVVIRGIGDYEGEKTKTFAITGTDLKKVKVAGVVTKEYTGDAIEQNAVLTYNGKPLTEGVDYSVKYEKHDKPGKATVIFTGMNSFTGIVKKSFTITPYAMDKDSASAIKVLLQSECSYMKGGAKPVVIVSYKGAELTEGVDYTLTYKNNKALTTKDTPENKKPQVLIKGKGKFKGTLPVTFSIRQAQLSQVNAVAQDFAYSTKKNAYKKVPVLLDKDGKKLQAGKDYEKQMQYTYADGSEITPGYVPQPGATLKVTITGKGNYAGTVSATYRVVYASLEKAKITVKNQTYTGAPIVPDKNDIVVRFGKEEPLKATDYEIIALENNVEKGTATITLRGVGKYGGIKKVKFKIVSKSFF